MLSKFRVFVRRSRAPKRVNKAVLNAPAGDWAKLGWRDGDHISEW